MKEKGLTNFFDKFLSKESIFMNKKVLQSGKWELRCGFVYKNSVFKNHLDKIPFVKNSNFLKKLYITHIYKFKNGQLFSVEFK